MSDSLQPHGLFSLLGSSVHGISQARILAVLSCFMSDPLQPCGLEPARLLSPRDSSGMNTAVGLPCPPSADLPDPGIKPTFLAIPALAGRFFATSATWETLDLNPENLELRHSQILTLGGYTILKSLSF